MNKDTVEGRWRNAKGKIKEKWGKLTDDDLDVLEGRWDQIAGLVQQRYGTAKDEAEKALKDIQKYYDDEAMADRR